MDGTEFRPEHPVGAPYGIHLADDARLFDVKGKDSVLVHEDASHLIDEPDPRFPPCFDSRLYHAPSHRYVISNQGCCPACVFVNTAACVNIRADIQTWPDRHGSALMAWNTLRKTEPDPEQAFVKLLVDRARRGRELAPHVPLLSWSDMIDAYSDGVCPAFTSRDGAKFDCRSEDGVDVVEFLQWVSEHGIRAQDPRLVPGPMPCEGPSDMPPTATPPCRPPIIVDLRFERRGSHSQIPYLSQHKEVRIELTLQDAHMIRDQIAAIKESLMENGPVMSWIIIEAESFDAMAYDESRPEAPYIYSIANVDSPSPRFELHNILIVGWTTVQGVPCWIAQNSYGANNYKARLASDTVPKGFETLGNALRNAYPADLQPGYFFLEMVNSRLVRDRKVCGTENNAIAPIPTLAPAWKDGGKIGAADTTKTNLANAIPSQSGKGFATAAAIFAFTSLGLLLIGGIASTRR